MARTSSADPQDAGRRSNLGPVPMHFTPSPFQGGALRPEERRAPHT